MTASSRSACSSSPSAETSSGSSAAKRSGQGDRRHRRAPAAALKSGRTAHPCTTIKPCRLMLLRRLAGAAWRSGSPSAPPGWRPAPTSIAAPSTPRTRRHRKYQRPRSRGRPDARRRAGCSWRGSHAPAARGRARCSTPLHRWRSCSEHPPPSRRTPLSASATARWSGTCWPSTFPRLMHVHDVEHLRHVYAGAPTAPSVGAQERCFTGTIRRVPDRQRVSVDRWA